jgi:hypothetical protein
MKRLLAIALVLVLVLSGVPARAQDGTVPDCDLTTWQVRGEPGVISNFVLLINSSVYEFEGEMTIADLGTAIAGLQAYRDDVEGIELPECLEQARTLTLEGMDALIQHINVNGDNTYISGFPIGSDNDYVIGMIRLGSASSYIDALWYVYGEPDLD